MRKNRLKVEKTEGQLIYAEMRALRNAVNKVGVTLDEILRIVAEHTGDDEEANNDDLL